MPPYAPYPLNVLRDGCHHRRWLIRGILAVILIPWTFFWAYNRLTATPAEPGGGGSLVLPPTTMPNFDAVIQLPRPDVDRTRELAAAIIALPAMPATQPLPTPPNGMMWQEWNPRNFGSSTLDVDQVYYGPWRPDRRLQQKLFLEYLDDPKVRKTLDEILALSDQPAALSHSRGLGYRGMAPFRQICRVLTARSRGHAEVGDHDAALRDLQAIIQLGENLEDDGLLIPVFVGHACRDLAMHEMVVQARTLPQSAAHRREVLHWLKDHPVDARALYQEASRGECELHYVALECLFPSHENGRERIAVDPGALAPGLDHFLRVQNLVAWAYDNRATHVSYIDAVCQAQYEAIGQTFAESSAQLSRLESFNPPPTRAYEAHVIDASFVIALNQADYEIALATLAVLAYEADHGSCPDQLADLIPEYLDEIPIDPFVDEPLRYRLDDHYGFIVYAVGKNMRDDGGQFQLPSGEHIPHEDLKDHFFARPREGQWRSPPYQEWYLVPADSSDQEKATSSTTETPR